MGRRRDGQGIDTGGQETLDIGIAGTAERATNELALLAIRIGHPGEPDPRHISEDARMIAAHDADADHPDAQQAVVAAVCGVPHIECFPLGSPWLGLFPS